MSPFLKFVFYIILPSYIISGILCFTGIVNSDVVPYSVGVVCLVAIKEVRDEILKQLNKRIPEV